MRQTLTAMRAKRAEGDRGFTLIELLVVVVIIGILVAIAIPVYMNYREGAADKSAQSDVRGGITAVENFYSVNANIYPDTMANNTANFTLTVASPPAGVTITTQKVSVSAATTISYIKVTTGTVISYRLCATNSGGSKKYLYDSTVGGSVKDAPTALNITTCA